MKLRIKGNSLRLRVTRSELTKVVNSGCIEETIHFASDQQAKLTCALELCKAPIRFSGGRGCSAHKRHYDVARKRTGWDLYGNRPRLAGYLAPYH
jgi:Family of unknown function (DUF7009)